MTEIWKDIVGYEGLYQVSNLGRAKSLTKRYGCCIRPEKIIAKVTNRQGYVVFNLRKDGRKKQVFLHRVVASAFVENPFGYPQVNHINGDKEDNRAENLEWCTAKENIHHAFATGLSVAKKGESHPMYGKRHSEETKAVIGEKSRLNWIKRKAGTDGAVVL